MSANIETYMHDLGRRARAAARVLARTDTASKGCKVGPPTCDTCGPQ